MGKVIISENRLKELEGVLSYTFKDKSIIAHALVHSSYVNEKKMGSLANNERLEFLGDAILGMSIAFYIYSHFKDMPEGRMSKLRAAVVCEATLAAKARELNLGSFLRLGKGEAASLGFNRSSILCDLMEAIIGAIYLDGGYDAANEYILRILTKEIYGMKDIGWIADAKTHLQEQLQKESQEPIEYQVINEEGPDHNKLFTVELHHGSRTLSQGKGKNKKEAEQNAARHAIEKYKLE